MRDSPTYGFANDAPHRVAVVGDGPRGLWLIDALSQAWAEARSGSRMPARFGDDASDPSSPANPAGANPAGANSTAALVIDWFGDAEHPGAGNVYHPNQPSHLRMNYATRLVDVSADGSYPLTRHLSEGPCVDPDGVVSRATVGGYLAARAKRAMRSSPPGVKIRYRRASIEQLDLGPEGVRLCRTSGQWFADTYDDVAVATGHEGWRAPAVDSATVASSDPSGRPSIIRGIYPVERLGPRSVAADSDVAIRGLGLTAIDALLTLTEGRGGSFERCGRRVRYRRGGGEPRRIRLYSRSNRPMLVKPRADRVDRNGRQAEFLRWTASQMTRRAAARDRVDFDRDILQPLLRAVDGLARELHREPPPAREWLQRQRRPAHAGGFIRTLRRSIEIAEGDRPPDVPHLLGAAWRTMYPAIVDLVGWGRASDRGRRRFAELAPVFERLAFGPPTANGRRMLALLTSGVAEVVGLPPHGNDVLIDARIPGPRQRRLGGVADHLIRDGWFDVDPVTGGVRCDREGHSLLTSDIDRFAGRVAIHSRVIEPWVPGFDSLSRTLHDSPRRWARSVVDRAVAAGDRPVPLAMAG